MQKMLEFVKLSQDLVKIPKTPKILTIIFTQLLEDPKCYKSIALSCLVFLFRWGQKTLVSGNAGDEKNLHPGGRRFIFFNRFSGDILFSSLVSLFSFILVFLCLFICCFLKLKIYILIHIRLSGRVNDKNLFTRSISGNKTTFFFGLTTASLTGFGRTKVMWRYQIENFLSHEWIVLPW